MNDQARPSRRQRAAAVLLALLLGLTMAITGAQTVQAASPSSVNSPARLTAGQSLKSPNGQYDAVMQGDGNFVVYRSGGVAIFNTGTAGVPGAFLQVQADGNVVVYGPNSVAKWNSQTAGTASASKLVMQDDGNLVLYSVNNIALWSSAGGRTGNAQDAVASQWTLSAGMALVSRNAQYQAVMQGDGNFVVYRTGGVPIFNTGTAGNPGAFMNVQSDGNAVVYGAGGAKWDSKTGGRAQATNLVMQDDSNLVLYVRGGGPLWSSNGGLIGGSTSSSLDARVDAFVAKFQGKKWDWDGYYGAQCTDLVEFYNRDVVGAPPIGGNGKDMYARASPAYYDKLPPSAAPRKGDIAVWNGNKPGSGGNGHVAIVLDSNLRTFAQSGDTTVARQFQENTNYLTGYLRPKK